MDIECNNDLTPLYVYLYVFFTYNTQYTMHTQTQARNTHVFGSKHIQFKRSRIGIALCVCACVRTALLGWMPACKVDVKFAGSNCTIVVDAHNAIQPPYATTHTNKEQDER